MRHGIETGRRWVRRDIKGDALVGVEEIEGKGRKRMWCVADVAVAVEVRAMVGGVVETLGGSDVVSARCLPVFSCLVLKILGKMVANAGIAT